MHCNASGAFVDGSTCLRTLPYVISNCYSMFWAGKAVIAHLLTSRSTATLETSESCTSGATGTGETQEVSSIQRESSGSDSNLSLREWPSVNFLVTNSSFSEAMSDRVTRPRVEGRAKCHGSCLRQFISFGGTPPHWAMDPRHQ